MPKTRLEMRTELMHQTRTNIAEAGLAQKDSLRFRLVGSLLRLI